MDRRPLARLRRVLAAGGWRGIDTETTGLGADAEVVEVAIVGPKLRYATLVRPRGPVADAAVALHGLRAEDLAGAPEFSDLAGEIRRQLTGRDVFAYPAAFDRRVLWREYARAGEPAPRCRWHCVAEALTRATGTRGGLRQVASDLGVPLTETAHRALPDARLLVSVAFALVGGGAIGRGG